MQESFGAQAVGAVDASVFGDVSTSEIGLPTPISTARGRRCDGDGGTGTDSFLSPPQRELCELLDGLCSGDGAPLGENLSTLTPSLARATASFGTGCASTKGSGDAIGVLSYSASICAGASGVSPARSAGSESVFRGRGSCGSNGDAAGGGGADLQLAVSPTRRLQRLDFPSFLSAAADSASQLIDPVATAELAESHAQLQARYSALEQAARKEIAELREQLQAAHQEVAESATQHTLLKIAAAEATRKATDSARLAARPARVARRRFLERHFGGEMAEMPQLRSSCVLNAWRRVTQQTQLETRANELVDVREKLADVHAQLADDVADQTMRYLAAQRVAPISTVAWATARGCRRCVPRALMQRLAECTSGALQERCYSAWRYFVVEAQLRRTHLEICRRAELEMASARERDACADAGVVRRHVLRAVQVAVSLLRARETKQKYFYSWLASGQRRAALLRLCHSGGTATSQGCFASNQYGASTDSLLRACFALLCAAAARSRWCRQARDTRHAVVKNATFERWRSRTFAEASGSVAGLWLRLMGRRWRRFCSALTFSCWMRKTVCGRRWRTVLLRQDADLRPRKYEARDVLLRVSSAWRAAAARRERLHGQARVSAKSLATSRADRFDAELVLKAIATWILLEWRRFILRDENGSVPRRSVGKSVYSMARAVEPAAPRFGMEEPRFDLYERTPCHSRAITVATRRNPDAFIQSLLGREAMLIIAWVFSEWGAACLRRRVVDASRRYDAMRTHLQRVRRTAEIVRQFNQHVVLFAVLEEWMSLLPPRKRSNTAAAGALFAARRAVQTSGHLSGLPALH
eukprot:TRINITY_DN74016_c0_g1_i1.p1 TRINITY_DN74016_c0_g1~~TRINITY_DN74016_c0_g1_i1.p1  ORF type:complete len:817 (+),score=75.02 TRINITY_DN74016_c0_g1_i1:144-2594(+)